MATPSFQQSVSVKVGLSSATSGLRSSGCRFVETLTSNCIWALAADPALPRPQTSAAAFWNRCRCIARRGSQWHVRLSLGTGLPALYPSHGTAYACHASVVSPSQLGSALGLALICPPLASLSAIQATPPRSCRHQPLQRDDLWIISNMRKSLSRNKLYTFVYLLHIVSSMHVHMYFHF